MAGEIILLIVTGLLAGTISGLMGVGGGIVMTPVLHYVIGLPWHTSVALSLFVIAVQAPMGIYQHATRDAVSWRIAFPLIGAGAVGVFVGQWLLPRVPVPTLRLAFGFILALAAWRLVAQVPVRDRPYRDWLGVPIGLVAGIVSRLLGVGGGIVTVPALAFAGVRTHLAVGSSLVAVFTNAALASAVTLALGLAWVRVVPIVAGALAGAVIGVRLAHRLPDKGLRRVVAGGMAVIALYIIATSGVWSGL